MAFPDEEILSNVWKDGLFAGKVVFATGGAGSIVSVQVRALVRLGADACIVGRNVAKTERVAGEIATVRSGSKVLGIGAVDVRKPQDLEQAVSRCIDALGGIDFVIRGRGNFLAPLEQISHNAFNSVVGIDLMGSWNTLKATMPALIKSAQKYRTDGQKSSPYGTGGRIIFISATASYMGNQLQTHAVVAKAGVDALSVQAAIELGPRGITSNVIAPGAIMNTEGTDRLIKNGNDKSVGKGVPSGRLGHVKDVADATIFLFSDAGNYVNGDILVGRDFPYPEFILSGEDVQGLKGGRKVKL